jgi:hypothetical protein
MKVNNRCVRDEFRRLEMVAEDKKRVMSLSLAHKK